MTTDKLGKLEQERERINRQIKRERERLRAEEQKQQQRRAVLIGAAVDRYLQEEPTGVFAEQVRRLVDEYVTEERDRALLNLPPMSPQSPEKKPPAPASHSGGFSKGTAPGSEPQGTAF